MTDYFTKTNTPTPYFEKPSTALKTITAVGSTSGSTANDPTAQLKGDLAKVESAYQKVTSKVVTKRYAVRQD